LRSGLRLSGALRFREVIRSLLAEYYLKVFIPDSGRGDAMGVPLFI
jgi:hypothetical protein